jgi:membrane associated rhomboid family serine protease
MRNTSSKLFFSLFFPTLFVIILWIVKFVEVTENISFAAYGIHPRTVHGLIGIFAAPLLHGDFDHLMSNTIPLIILGPIIFYFYRTIAFQVFVWVYVMTGVWVWVAARDFYHIGASGIVYGFISFLFFSGVFRKDARLLGLSLFVTFLYGSAIWGIFPIQPGISFESHLLGALAGLITAYHFRREGPVSKKYDLGNDDENELIDVSGEQEFSSEEALPPPMQLYYTYIEKKKEENE